MVLDLIHTDLFLFQILVGGAAGLARVSNHEISGCIKCVSLSNWPCQTRLTLVNINSVNKCGGSTGLKAPNFGYKLKNASKKHGMV